MENSAGKRRADDWKHRRTSTSSSNSNSKFVASAGTCRRNYEAKASDHFVTKYFTNEFLRIMLWMYKYYWMKKLNRINYPLLLLTVFCDLGSVRFGREFKQQLMVLWLSLTMQSNPFELDSRFVLWLCVAIVCNFSQSFCLFGRQHLRDLREQRSIIRRIPLFIFKLSKWIFFHIQNNIEILDELNEAIPFGCAVSPSYFQKIGFLPAILLFNTRLPHKIWIIMWNGKRRH